MTSQPARDRTSPDDLLAEVVERFDATPDPRLREVMQSLVQHLHGFVRDVRLTPEEWERGIQFLTATGQACDDKRQEFILLSDTLGASMLVDALANDGDDGATESTVLGPFYVPESPVRDRGETIAERPSGEPAWITGHVLDAAGAPIAGAELDVWQNGADHLYAVQDPTAPPTNLRGRFRADADGSFAFLAVRPTAYTIPDDGPVGQMLRATRRHPWRPAHLHVIVRAPGFRPVTTHLFDEASDYLDGDAVFGVKPSLVCRFDSHPAGDPSRPPGIAEDEQWSSAMFDFVLARA